MNGAGGERVAVSGRYGRKPDVTRRYAFWERPTSRYMNVYEAISCRSRRR